MSKAQNGQQMFLDDALKLLDKNGEAIKFEEQEDGSYTARLEEKKTKDVNGKELPGHIYTYTLTLRPQIVDVTVIEQVEGEPKPGPLTGEEAKKADEETKKQAQIEESIAAESQHESKTAKSSKNK